MVPRRHPTYSKFRAAALESGTLRPGMSVLAACSGGPDSVALLHLLLELGGEIPLTVAVAHFNHRLRAAASDDESFVRELARRLGLRFHAGRRDVRAFARRVGMNLEEAGRMLRYGFLFRIAGRTGADAVATGHTLSDQAETVLMRILRGTGPSGLSGIAAPPGGPVFRPMLGLTRADVLAYLRSRGIGFREDESNRDPRILRNRIRHRLIPYLETRFEPAVVRSLGRLAAIAADESAYLDRMAAAAMIRLMIERPDGPAMSASGLRALPPGLARRVVRVFLVELGGDPRGFPFERVNAVLAMADGSALPLSKDLILERRRDFIGRGTGRLPPEQYSLLWDGRGDLPVPGTGLVFSGRFARTGSPKTSPVSVLPAGGDEAGCALDADTLEFPVLVRVRRPGDLYRPLGAPGRKKLKEILRAKGVPRDERDRRPVFLSKGGIVWVWGLPVAEAHKITPRTRRRWIVRASAPPGGPPPQRR